MELNQGNNDGKWVKMKYRINHGVIQVNSNCTWVKSELCKYTVTWYLGLYAVFIEKNWEDTKYFSILCVATQLERVHEQNAAFRNNSSPSVKEKTQALFLANKLWFVCKCMTWMYF